MSLQPNESSRVVQYLHQVNLQQQNFQSVTLQNCRTCLPISRLIVSTYKNIDKQELKIKFFTEIEAVIKKENSRAREKFARQRRHNKFKQLGWVLQIKDRG